MQHPEEGIIHAWLDGALPSAEAVAIESHVESCADCAARVAEARGLIAAASRVVGHLDVVPGGVIPKVPARKPRLWIRAAWPAALAATLILGISLSNRSEKSSILDQSLPPSMAPMPGPQALILDSGPVPGAAPERAAGRVTGSTSRGSELAMTDTVTLPPPAAALQKGAPPPATVPTSPSVAVAPQRGNARAADSRLSRVEITGARQRGAGLVSAGVGAAAAAPPAMAGAEQATLADRATDEAVRAFAACYEMNVSTDILPDRFALTAEPAAVPGLMAVRYVDSTSQRTTVIVDAGWTVEGGRAVVKTAGRGTILTLSKTGSGISGDSPNGARSGRVTSCR